MSSGLIPREAGSRSTVVAHFEGGGVDGGRKRMVVARSEGGEAEVDGGRKRMAMARSEGGGVEVNGLRKRTATACFEAGVEAAACSEARDEVAACSEARIEDDRWWRHNSF
jgi:hypothetical protein